MHDHYNASIWYSWKYNEIIGYLNLYILGSQFRADVWMVKKCRHYAGITKKKFLYCGKAFEKQIPRGYTSSEIFKFMIDQLLYINSKDYKRRHFDLRAFKAAGRFIDWNGLIEKLNQFDPEFRKNYSEDAG